MNGEQAHENQTEQRAQSTQSANKRIVKKAAKKRRRRFDFSKFFAVLIVFLTFYLGISLFIAGSIYYSFTSTAKNTEIYSLNVIYDETVVFKASASTVNNEYGLYIPFDSLASIANIGLAGDGDDVTIFLIGSDNRIECTKNSSLIVINDNPVRISSPILYENGDYLIPVLLVENYINGIDVVYDDEKMVCQVINDIGKSDIELTLHLPEDMKKADFPDSYKDYIYDTSNPNE